jgi:elongation factor 2
MGKITIDQMVKTMEKVQNIRNISVIAHVDHGKTTLTDSLVAKAGIIAQEKAGNTCFTHLRKDEKERGVTIKSTSISLGYEYDPTGNNQPDQFLINLIDSPGHVDFSSEVTAALRVTDGALVVVDSIEGVCVQTGTVLRQAMAEKIRPVLIINKIDRNILELQEDGEAIYQSFVKTIDNVNVITSNYEHPDMGDLTLHPSLGNIAFGAGKDAWGFTLTKFARLYSKKFGISETKLMEKLWGDHYFDRETNKWTTEPISASGKPLARGFVKFIMEPIIKLTKTILEGTEEQIEKSIGQIDVHLTKQEKELKGKALMRAVFSKWMNCADCLLEMFISHLPSPKVAQKYRGAYLYEGPQDDACAQAIRDCDPSGPLMMYVSKMVPSQDKGRFYAFGRVFSGTIFAGQKVRIMGANYKPGSKEDVVTKSIPRVGILIGKDFEAVTEIPCGNTVSLVGVDQYLMKTGTISDSEDAHNIRTMKYSVSPVVRVAVEAKKATDLPKLVEGLNKLSQADPIVQVYREENGQHIVAGTGELHMEICMKDLEEEYAQCEIKKSDPVVTYKETISEISSQVCLSKSTNKLNRIFCRAQPLDEELAELIEKGTIGPKSEPKERSKKLMDDFGWEKEDSERIWTFGPDNVGANMLIDMTKGVQYMHEIKDSMKSAFQWATSEGVIAEESLRRVRINIMDAQIHSDAVHRGAGQIISAARRVYYACELTAQPKLQEPIFLAEITAPTDVLGGIYQCLNQRRGQIFEEEPLTGTALTLVKAHLPVSESFGFTGHLRSLTSGQAFPQCVFSHWSEMTGDPYDKTSKVYEIVAGIRKRKGLKEELPSLSDYLDKL